MNIHQFFSIALPSEDLKFINFLFYLSTTVVIATLLLFWGFKDMLPTVAGYFYVFIKSFSETGLLVYHKIYPDPF